MTAKIGSSPPRDPTDRLSWYRKWMDGSCCINKNQEHLNQTENTMEKHHYGQKPENIMQES